MKKIIMSHISTFTSRKNTFKISYLFKGIIIVFTIFFVLSCSLANETPGKYTDVGVNDEVSDEDLLGYEDLTRASSSYIEPYIPGTMILNNAQSFKVITHKQISRVTWSYSPGLKGVYGGTNFIHLLATTTGKKVVKGTVLYTDNTYEILRYYFTVITMIRGNPGEQYLGDSVSLNADVESGYLYKWTLSSGLQVVYGGTYPDYTFIAFKGVTAGKRTVRLTRTHKATGRYQAETISLTIWTTTYYIAETWRDGPDEIGDYNDYTIAQPSRTQISRSGWSWHHHIDVFNCTNMTKYDDIYLLVEDTEVDYDIFIVWDEIWNRPIIEKIYAY